MQKLHSKVSIKQKVSTFSGLRWLWGGIPDDGPFCRSVYCVLRPPSHLHDTARPRSPLRIIWVHCDPERVLEGGDSPPKYSYKSVSVHSSSVLQLLQPLFLQKGPLSEPVLVWGRASEEQENNRFQMYGFSFSRLDGSSPVVVVWMGSGGVRLTWLGSPGLDAQPCGTPRERETSDSSPAYLLLNLSPGKEERLRARETRIAPI